MNKPKDFDCVEMKWQAQRVLQEKYAGVPEKEARRKQQAEVLADPILGPFVSKLLAKEGTVAHQ